MTDETTYTLGEIASLLSLELEGDADTLIKGIATLKNAEAGQLSFYHNKRFYQDLITTQASAVIIRPDLAGSSPVSKLLSDNPYLSYAKVSSLFAYVEDNKQGIHSSALVHPSAQIDPSVSLAAHVVIGANCRIGANTIIGANSVVGDNCTIDKNCSLAANVTLYHGVSLGADCIVHSGVVIGSDGFGFAPSPTGHHKIEQLGGVRIGKNVEIGANSTIDRGALDDTTVGDGVKIDNQVQIAHNVRIGTNTIICGCSAIAGSSTIGNDCIIAGAVGVINHVTICDKVTVTAMSLVNQSINEPGVYSSGTGLDQTSSWKKNIVRFRQLDDIWKKLLKIEKN